MIIKSYKKMRISSRLLFTGLIPLVTLTGSVLAQSGKPIAPAKSSDAAAVTYKDIQPLLKSRCVVCHSQDMLANGSVSGGLALDTYAAMTKGVITDKGPRPVLIAGKSDGSELYQRLVTTSPTKLMPRGGPALPAAQIVLFKKWIDAGAPGPATETARPKTGGNSLPMPANVGTLDINLTTRIALTPDMLTKSTDKVDKAGKTKAKDAALAFAMKIGPLPPLTAIAFSPDGKRLAVGGYRAMILWDTTTGQPVGAISGLAGPVQSLAYRPDGTQLAIAGGTAGVSGEVKIIDTKTLAQVGPILGGHTDVVFNVAWSSDGARLATGSQDKTARLWEWPSGKELLALKDHSDAVTRVAFALDGKSLYTASLDHNARRFDCKDGKVIRVFTGHAEGITAMALSPKGDRLLTAGSETEIRWWPVEAGDPARQGGHTGPVNDIVFSKDFKLVATASADNTVRLWDGSSTGQIRALTGSSDWMYAAAISPDDKLVAGAGADGIVRIWEAGTGRLRLSLIAWPPNGKSSVIDYASITPEGYFDASPAWTARLRPEVAEQNTPLPKLAEFVRGLRQPENVLKCWQAAPLEPAKLEAAKPAIPVMPAKAGAATPPAKTDAKTPAKPDAKTPPKG